MLRNTTYNIMQTIYPIYGQLLLQDNVGAIILEPYNWPIVYHWKFKLSIIPIRILDHSLHRIIVIIMNYWYIQTIIILSDHNNYYYERAL